MDKIHNGLQWLKGHILEKPHGHSDHPSCQFKTDKQWLDLRFGINDLIIQPKELENEIDDPPDPIDENILDKIQGSLIGMALGDALGAHVEFRPHEYLLSNPVKDLEGGGTWSLRPGQFTDNTSMALCLGNSLVARRGFVPYDQLVRYKWWYYYGYMSSIGKCFNIGTATKDSLDEFIRRQNKFGKKQKIHVDKLDYLSNRQLLEEFPVNCSKPGIAGSGALMRLAPVPLFFYEHLYEAIELSGYSGQITHGDRQAYDACRYFGALIYAALNNYTKAELLDKNFYEKNKLWFGYTPLCYEIETIAQGSYKRKGGYDDGIRGKGYIVNALEAALWAFWSDENNFEKGVLAAVNLGDDTDTTAAIYGQLAGAYYGYKNLPMKWVDQIYAKKYILQLSKWIAYEGKNWKETEIILSSDQSLVSSVSPTSAEQMFANDFLMSNVPPRWRRSFGSVSSGTMSKCNGSGSSTMKLSSALTSAQNRSTSNDEIHDRSAPPDYQHDATNSFPEFRNVTASPSSQTNSLSAPDLQHKKLIYDDVAPPAIDWNLREICTVTLTSIGQTTTDLNQECKNITDVPISPGSCSHVSNGIKLEPLQVFKSLPKVPDPNLCNNWSCEDVCSWIRSLGSIYETYVDAFQRHNINGHRLLNFVDNEALIEFGVTSTHNRRVIIYSIKQLKDKHATTTTLSDSIHFGNFYDEFAGDFVPSLYLTDSTYPNTMSCILKPFQDGTHLVLYDQIIKWLGPLSSDINIDKIELVHNPESYRMFLQQINRTERKQTQDPFRSHLDIESNPIERKKVLEHLQTLIQQVNHNRTAPIVRVWHGCKRAIVSPLVSDGFAALGKLDNGWFGKAMYFTSSAEYAAKYTNPTGCLIMCYVVLLNPFPVITDDAPPGVSSKTFRFYGTGNYSNYQCHYIPVAPVKEDTSWNFRPPPNGVQDARFDEFAIFQQADILPQVIVHLKPGTSSSPDTINEDSQTVFLSKE